MKINQGSKKIKNGTQTAIIEFEFSNYTIFVFQGTISEFDIVVKYKKEKNKLCTPKHIHWVVDILMKMQSKKKLAKAFLLSIKSLWDSCQPLQNNDFNTLKNLVLNCQNTINASQYSQLNRYGEYDVEFLLVLMQLLAVQEKTNRADAYMFGKIIEELLEADTNIFKIVSTAGYGGRK